MSVYTKKRQEDNEPNRELTERAGVSNSDKDELIRKLLERIDELESTIQDLLDWKGGMSNWTESNTDRIAELEDKIEELEARPADPKGGGETDKDASPSRGSTTEVIDLIARQTDDELLRKGKSVHVRIAAELHRRPGLYAKDAPKGKVLNQDNSLRKRLKSALEIDKLDWTQVYRAFQYLDRESGRYADKDTNRHGRILVRSPTPSSPPQG